MGWNQWEDNELRRMALAGAMVPEMASHLLRTENSVVERLYRLGITQPGIKQRTKRGAPCPLFSAEIIGIVAAHFGVDKALLLSRRLERRITRVRHVAALMLREFTNLSLPHIAEAFDLKNHTTIIHAAKSVARNMAADECFGQAIDAVRKRIVAAIAERRAQRAAERIQRAAAEALDAFERYEPGLMAGER